MEEPNSPDPYLASCQELYDWLSSHVAREAIASERSLVLVGIARLETELEQALKAKMVINPLGQDNLFDNDRPLGTFSAKTVVAYRFGLIDESFHDALQIIGRIQHEFVHSVTLMRLSDSPHKERITELVHRTRFHSCWNMALSFFPKPWFSEAATQFGAAIIVMSISLLASRHKEEPFQCKAKLSFS